MAKKERLDLVLVKQGLFDSRQAAQKRIMAGEVLVDEQKIDKAGTQVSPTAKIRLLGKDLPYVSRGGLKLKEAIDVFGLDFQDRVVCDLGASTGGFVDCALQSGARKVYAIDVGTNQLAWSLRTHPQVDCREQTNARYLTAEDFPELMDWVTTDVSFISLSKIFPAAAAILKDEGEMVALIKPQFEAGRDHVGKHGVVKDPAVHRTVIAEVIAAAEGLGLCPRALTPSPVRGPAGNVEYLLWLSKNRNLAQDLDIPAAVEAGMAIQ
ncbi:TlyA family RNA methyltransferase [Peptococcus simiae]|uniref:TlyA family RNA methyltransferase n=1 Tax=Peptococcus simiae TaxID=1643805 RepID=UPI00397F3807